MTWRAVAACAALTMGGCAHVSAPVVPSAHHPVAKPKTYAQGYARGVTSAYRALRNDPAFHVSRQTFAHCNMRWGTAKGNLNRLNDCDTLNERKRDAIIRMLDRVRNP